MKSHPKKAQKARIEHRLLQIENMESLAASRFTCTDNTYRQPDTKKPTNPKTTAAAITQIFARDTKLDAV